jgi:hypothetical protein
MLMLMLMLLLRGLAGQVGRSSAAWTLRVVVHDIPSVMDEVLVENVTAQQLLALLHWHTAAAEEVRGDGVQLCATHAQDSAVSVVQPR